MPTETEKNTQEDNDNQNAPDTEVSEPSQDTSETVSAETSKQQVKEGSDNKTATDTETGGAETTPTRTTESTSTTKPKQDKDKDKESGKKGRKDGRASSDSNEDSDNDNEVRVEDIDKKTKKVLKPEKVKKFISKSEDGADYWEPKTRLGRMVKNGDVTNIKDALATGLPIREPEIVDILLPDLDDEVLDVNMVQRMTDSGRRVRFAIMTVVGNGNGYVGLGSAKGKEVGPAIRKAIDNAKLNLIEIRRGCGSWECGCDTPHTLPFMVNGKSGSTVVKFRPAPRGVGLAVGDVAKHILRLSGIKDAWGFTRGETRTTINYAKAVFNALRNTARLKTMDSQVKDLNILSGSIAEEDEMMDNVDAGSDGIDENVNEN
jgi:small subunit ribosomal protein S5